MKYLLSIFTCIGFLLFSLNFAVGHHMAEGIVDAEVYAMIDALVADTPHAEMTELPAMDPPDRLIYADSVQFLENMIADGLLDYVGMLDGDVYVVLDFNVEGNRNGVAMSIYQDTME